MRDNRNPNIPESQHIPAEENTQQYDGNKAEIRKICNKISVYYPWRKMNAQKHDRIDADCTIFIFLCDSRIQQKSPEDKFFGDADKDIGKTFC